ncbi:GNAT family N-acetyltransferase [Streptomyces hoynatensis]|uniref:N-acetyltransferase n=1 Tax=Streptomyces hoynatensis TaxID=1141874 RepID=A0A3A9YRY0_9ACTN|nr:GNAT family N-acetyltransferase [Streptomyces hoynatensis]RKN38559.1 N-acetyltransferase [Streptomyces hoynatensis]
MTTTEHLTFREAGESDIPAIVALVESAYRGESSRAGWTTEADLLDGQRTDPEGVREALAAPGSLLLAAERLGELVACCHLERRAGAGGRDAAYFGMFAVRPTLQGGGLGRRVLAEAERRARTEWAAGEMHMQVISARADLIAWYERRGYARTGRTSAFPYGDERFGIPRRSDLEFELLVKPLR